MKVTAAAGKKVIAEDFCTQQAVQQQLSLCAELQDDCSASRPDCWHAALVLPCRLAASQRSKLGTHRSKKAAAAVGCHRHVAICAQCLCAALMQAPPAKKVESEEESSDEESSDEEEVRATVTTPSRASCCCVLLVGGPVLLAGDSA